MTGRTDPAVKDSVNFSGTDGGFCWASRLRRIAVVRVDRADRAVFRFWVCWVGWRRECGRRKSVMRSRLGVEDLSRVEWEMEVETEAAVVEFDMLSGKMEEVSWRWDYLVFEKKSFV